MKFGKNKDYSYVGSREKTLLDFKEDITKKLGSNYIKDVVFFAQDGNAISLLTQLKHLHPSPFIVMLVKLEQGFLKKYHIVTQQSLDISPVRYNLEDQESVIFQNLRTMGI